MFLQEFNVLINYLVKKLKKKILKIFKICFKKFKKKNCEFLL